MIESKARELEVAECMNCIAKVYDKCDALEEAFSYYVGSVAIYSRSHLLSAVSNQATIMVRQ